MHHLKTILNFNIDVNKKIIYKFKNIKNFFI